MSSAELETAARRNVRSFTLFRAFFSARFYYPVYALLFLDYGLTLGQFGMLNALWAVTIVLLEIPSGALADTIGRRKLLIFGAVCMLLEMGVLLLAPIGAGTWLFVLFAFNRLLSGAAEAAVSVRMKRWPMIHSRLQVLRVNGVKCWKGSNVTHPWLFFCHDDWCGGL